MDEKLIDEMNEALEYAQTNPNKIEKRIELSFEEIIQEQAGSDIKPEDLLSKDNTKNLVAFIVDSLKNHAIKHLRKRNYTFSPYLTGLAMDQYV